ncbi:MAG TPA: MarR family transcriptional regulator [Beijerinckiaceae bacterium]|nr:MarR family transcriptional regulator [Beijerinckiaceae bacterium]
MNDRPAAAMRDSGVTAVSAPEGRGTLDPVALVELIFFAYRDFIGEPDRVLERYGFGRAHHRVLHFVNRNPGLTVAELLSILDITKQSLGRVLRDLVAGGFIVQKAGQQDRRQRLMYLSATGTALAEELLGLQTRRMGRALERLSEAEVAAVTGFLGGLIDADQRSEVARLTRLTLDQRRR